MTDRGNFVAVDTSSRYCNVLAKKGGRISQRFIGNCALSHSTKLMGEVDAAMDEIGLTPAECDFFCAVTGPGSFTGIRIGIATAKGLAAGAGKKCLAVTSFELIAYNVTAERFCAVIDAAHGHYYACAYENGKAVLPPRYLSEEEVTSLSVPLYGYEDLPLGRYEKLDIKNCFYPAICRVERQPSDELHALYIRKSQAEEGRK